MPFTFTMPKLSPTMTSGTIAKWHKKEGEHVAAGEMLLEISTDKATVEHEALDEGWLRQILVKEGEEAEINQPIAIFTETKDESVKGYAPKGQKEEPKMEKPAAPTKPAKTSAAPAPAPVAVQTEASPSERLRASPLARKLAVQQGLDLSKVTGTGPGERIMSRDLAQAKPAAEVSFTRQAQPTGQPGAFEEVALTPIRRVIAQRLQEAKSTIPHFYVRQAVNAEPLIAVRDQLEKGGLTITFNDMLIKACALALRAYPDVNCGYQSANDTIIRFKSIDISVAVSIPDGLITPIVWQADYKNLGEISAEVKTLAKRAKEGKLQPKEFQGGSFTISNMGMYGIDDFTAVINPPQAAILAVGGIHEVPVVREGKVVPGKEMGLVLSSDHRVVDGALAARFIKKVQHFLENPSLLLI